MHPNPAFRTSSDARNIAFARAQGFGVLSLNGPEVPLISHIPFLLSEDGAVVEFHLVRSNPIARAIRAPRRAKLAVQGAHSYISPDWYEVEDQVPTWNYIAVHLSGQVELQPQDSLLDLLDRQSEQFEQLLQPKPPWRTDKMTPKTLDSMMRQIVPCRMVVDDLQGTWKLNQNKPDEVRLRAADQVERHGFGQDVNGLAALMRTPDEP